MIRLLGTSSSAAGYRSLYLFSGARRDESVNLVLSRPYSLIKGSLSTADPVQELGSISQGF